MMYSISILLTLASGLMISLQSPTNSALAKHTGNIQASAVSFGVATVLLLFASWILGSGSLASVTLAEWWMVLGGLYGGYQVFIVTTSAPELGIALTLTFSMFGQIFMGAIVDRFGWFGMARIDPDPLLICGFTLVAAGILLVYRSSRIQDSRGNAAGSRKFLLGVLVFLGGMGIAVQAPTNTALAVLVGRVEASFFSFLGGFLFLLLFTLFFGRRIGSSVKRYPVYTIRPWMLTGGVYGAAIVLFTIIATPSLGVALVLGICMLGQLAGALLVDTFGLFQARRIPLNRTRIGGILLIAAGAVLLAAGRL